MTRASTRDFPRSTAALAVGLAVLSVAVLAGHDRATQIIAIAVLAVPLGVLVVRIAAHWSLLVCGLAAIDLVIPQDDRYTVIGAGGVGFQIEPYRAVVVLLIVGWIAAMLVDPRVRARTTKLEGPLALFGLAVLGSELFNLDRVTSLTSFVIKDLVLISCLILFVYVFVSAVRTRTVLDRLISVTVVGGCVEAFGAIIEREASYNIFNHLHRLLPFLSFNPGAELTSLLRNGHFRAIASAGHPIELSNVLVMICPLAVYLAITRRKAWWGAVMLLLMGNLVSGSRTGMVGLVVVVVVFLCMRPRETLKYWPALIPILALLELFAPNTINGVVSSFFPKGGLIAQQSQTFHAYGQVQQANRLSRLGPQLHEFAQHNEFFGIGFGTRVIGRTGQAAGTVSGRAAGNNAQVLDDQWLGTLLETGFVGLAAWLWLFARLIRRLAKRAKADRGSKEGWLAVSLAASIAVYAVSMYFYDALGFMQGTVLLFILISAASVVLQLPRGASQRRLHAVSDRLISPSGAGRRALALATHRR